MSNRNHRERLFHEQGGLCFYCKEPMILMAGPYGKRAPGKMATLDHLQPVSKGGRRSPTLNCVAACVSCNQKRGTRSVAKFIAWRQMMDAKFGKKPAQAIEARRAETANAGSVHESAVGEADAPGPVRVTPES